jgi:hypothetical protein
MNATDKQIEIFWHYYWIGDGSKVEYGKDPIIHTTSKKIRDQLLELSQKMGLHANFSTDDRDLSGRIINEKYTQKTSHPCYKISNKYQTNKTSFNIKKIKYNGKVYCVSVPNTILYVRRNGKTSWCGNSMNTNKKYLARSMLFWMVEFLKKTYDFVNIVFIVHTTEAIRVDEHAFFHKSESGGTYCSSAFKLANYIIDTEFPINEWNVYSVYISDGEDFDTSKTPVFPSLTSKSSSLISFNFSLIFSILSSLISPKNFKVKCKFSGSVNFPTNFFFSIKWP